MTTIEAPTNFESAAKNDRLTGELREGYAKFQRGEYDQSFAQRIYREVLTVADLKMTITGVDPLVEAAREANRWRVDKGDFSHQIRRARRQNDFSNPFFHFEQLPQDRVLIQWSVDFNAPKQNAVEDMKEWLRAPLGTKDIRKSAKAKSLGEFYFYLAGVLAVGDEHSGQGFANPEANFEDMLVADYFFDKGLEMENIVYGDWWETEWEKRGMGIFGRNLQVEEKRKREEILSGMYRDKSVVLGLIRATRQISLAAWEEFLAENPDISESEREIGEIIIADNRRVIAEDQTMYSVPTLEELTQSSIVELQQGLA